MAQASRRRHPVGLRAMGWLGVALMVTLSLVGPGTAGVVAAGPPEGGSGDLTVQADAPLQPTLGNMVAGTTNPALTGNVCYQADFGFAIDRSGSIESAGANLAERNGINGFVDAFQATGDGRYAGARFNGTTAATISSGFVSAATFKSAVTTLAQTTPTGRTPTGAGISTASGNVANNRADPPNVLFVVTDGSPNVPWSNANINTNYPADPNGWLAGANAAITAANAARAAGWVVKAIYVGSPDSGLPFSAANDQVWVQNVMSRIGGGEYTQIANFASLVPALLISVGCATPTPTPTPTPRPRPRPRRPRRRSRSWSSTRRPRRPASTRRATCSPTRSSRRTRATSRSTT